MQLMGSDQLLGTGRNVRPAAQCEPADCAQYSGPRAQAILYLRPRLSAEMRNLGVDYLFQEVELPLSRVLAAMEQEGVAVDVPYLRDMQEELQEQLKALEEEVAQVSGYSFNLNAPQQLARLGKSASSRRQAWSGPASGEISARARSNENRPPSAESSRLICSPVAQSPPGRGERCCHS